MPKDLGDVSGLPKLMAAAAAARLQSGRSTEDCLRQLDSGFGADLGLSDLQPDPHLIEAVVRLICSKRAGLIFERGEVDNGLPVGAGRIVVQQQTAL